MLNQVQHDNTFLDNPPGFPGLRLSPPTTLQRIFAPRHLCLKIQKIYDRIIRSPDRLLHNMKKVYYDVNDNREEYMYGAILGDIIGQPFEFDRGFKTKDFPLFSERPHFTDDTVMTIAICDGILKAGLDADESTMKNEMIKSMHLWGHKYPHAGYGQKFYLWIAAKKTEPYGSYGNGSAMRVSSVGWLFETLERTREVAGWSAEITHNHPEGIKGAEAAASVIWMALLKSPECRKVLSCCAFRPSVTRTT